MNGAPGGERLPDSRMTDPAQSLRNAVERALPRLLALGEDTSRLRPAPGRWSPREVIGHLIDSAVNNDARFVRGALGEDLVFAGYDQDAWVRVQGYHAIPWSVLVPLWAGLNHHVADIMAAAPAEARGRPHVRHNLDAIAWRRFPPDVPATLDEFMRDYVGHLEHHLAQIPGIG